MKNSIITFFFAAAAAAAAVSCAKEADLKVADKAPAKGIKVNVIAGEITTKTYVEDGEIPVVKWSEGDQVALFEAMDGELTGAAYSDPANIEEGKASFSTTLDWEAEGGSSYKYSAVYPASAVIEYNDDLYVYLPEKQTLNGNNLPENSDILLSTLVDKGASRVASGENIQFAFRRLGTVVRMTLNGIAPGEKIRQIEISAPAYIAGALSYDPLAGGVDPETAFDLVGYNYMTLEADDLEATGNDVIWFRVLAERDWGETGDYLAFTVSTDKNVYQKEFVTCPVIRFVDGGLTKFSVDLSSSLVEPLALPYSESFESGAPGWSIRDDDGDGYNWFLLSSGGNSGDYCLASASYYSSTALTPDNWLFTPPIQLTEGNYLSFFVRAAYTSYPYEHYAVYIAEGSPAGDTEVLLPETEFPAGSFVEMGKDGVYEHYIIQIPAEYDNKSVCIGFRHFNCTDQYYLLLDDVSITEDYPPLVSPPLDAKYEDYLGQWAEGANVFTIEQKVAGESYSISGLTGQGEYPVEAVFADGRLVLYEQIVGADGESEVALQGLFSNGGYLDWNEDYSLLGTSVLLRMSYDDAPSLTIDTFNSYIGYIWTTYVDESYTGYSTRVSTLPATLTPYVPDTTTYIYMEDFEKDPTDEWTLIDYDGDGYNWYHANFAAHSGAYHLSSESYTNSIGALTPDNWAFTPPITLTSDNYLSFWVRPQDPSWGAEHYIVYIIDEAPTAENLPNCAVLLEEHEYPEGDYVEIASDGYYQRFVVPIPSSYDGKEVYIGFCHFNCTDMFRLNIDDVAVSEGNPVPNNASPTFKTTKAAAPKVRDFSLMGADKPIPSRVAIADLRMAR